MTESAWYNILRVCAIAVFLIAAGCGKKTVADPSDGMDTMGSGTTTDTDGMDRGDSGGNDGIDTNPDEYDRPRTLTDVFFDLDAYSLRGDARRAIQANADAILANPEWRIVTLEGHCDERGTVEYNLALGQKRADSVKSYLRDLGVPSDRMQTISYGEERPFDNGYGEAAWAQNRRVHFSR